MTNREALTVTDRIGPHRVAASGLRYPSRVPPWIYHLRHAMQSLLNIADRTATPLRARARARAVQRIAGRTRRHIVWRWMWLLVLVLLAQSLGQVHIVLHAATPHADISAERLLGRNDIAHEGGQWLSRLFAGHANASDCRLYDQVSHGDCMPTAALLMPVAMVAPVWTALFPASARARPTLRLRARSPPIRG